MLQTRISLISTSDPPARRGSVSSSASVKSPPAKSIKLASFEDYNSSFTLGPSPRDNAPSSPYMLQPRRLTMDMVQSSAVGRAKTITARKIEEATKRSNAAVPSSFPGVGHVCTFVAIQSHWTVRLLPQSIVMTKSHRVHFRSE